MLKFDCLIEYLPVPFEPSLSSIVEMGQVALGSLPNPNMTHFEYCLANPPKTNEKMVQSAILMWDTVALCFVSSFTRMVYQYVEVSHPIYAVVFQIMIVSCLFNWVRYGLELYFHWHGCYKIWLRWDEISGGLFYLFHEGSWVVLSTARYYFVLHKDKINEWNFSTLRGRMLGATWIIFLLHYLSMTGTWIALAGTMGWPEKNQSEFTFVNKIIIHIQIAMFMAFPDLINVLIYFKLRRSQKKNLIHPQSSCNSVVDFSHGFAVAHFGGVYVGEPLQDLEQGQSLDHLQYHNTLRQEKDELDMAMNALQTHLWACFGVIPVMFFSMLPDGFARTVLVSISLTVYRAYLPFLLATRNFGQLSKYCRIYFSGIFRYKPC